MNGLTDQITEILSDFDESELQGQIDSMDGFLLSNNSLTELNLPKIEIVRNWFLTFNKSLLEFHATNLKGSKNFFLWNKCVRSSK